MRDGINHAYVQTRLIASVRTGAPFRVCRASVRKMIEQDGPPDAYGGENAYFVPLFYDII